MDRTKKIVIIRTICLCMFNHQVLRPFVLDCICFHELLDDGKVLGFCVILSVGRCVYEVTVVLQCASDTFDKL